MSNKLQEMDIVAKMSIIGALIVLLIIMAVVIVSCSNSEPAVDIESGFNPNTEENPSESTPKVYARVIGVVTGIDQLGRTVFLTNVDNYEKTVLNIPENLSIYDAYGTIMAFNQLVVGDLIESKYDIETNIPDNLKISNLGWEKKNIKNMSIDIENKTIRVFNDTYQFTEDIVLYFGDEIVSIDSIDPADELIIRGYLNTVWSISLLSKHGFVVLTGETHFIGGTLEINKNYVIITDDTRVTVPVGSHNVVITKPGFDPYVTQVNVVEGVETTIDLSSVQAEIGSVLFTIAQTDATLYIDNERISDLSAPINLSYGPHDILVEKDNYLPWTTVLYVNQPYQDFNIDLDQQKLMIKVDTPIETELYINDVYIGEIPIQAPISQGTHTLTLKKEGYYPKTQNISIDNEVGVFEFSFPELIENPNYTGGMVSIQVDNPVGSELYIGANLLGTIPVSTTVASGTHQLTIRKDGYYAKLYTITVEAASGPYLYTFPDLLPIEAEATPTPVPEVTPTPETTVPETTPDDLNVNQD